MDKILSRRKFIKLTGIMTIGSVLLSKIGIAQTIMGMMKNTAILRVKSLSLPWETQDPFIFCSYHYDTYPGGNENLGPKSSLEGRSIGQDFSAKDGWSMYHGTEVPGFPAHPHSGFETVSVVTQGMVDHSDSLGAKGRFGNGDVQWLTSGKGVQHAEMFPLLDQDSNPFEIFQIWLNLPQKDKKVEPYYKMLWSEDIPIIVEKDKQGKQTSINLVAGTHKGKQALSPTPNSWASDPNNHVQIWTIKMDAHAEFVLPSIDEDVNRTIYFHEGSSFSIDETEIELNHLVDLKPEIETHIKNGDKEAYFLFLQGRPINEPIVQYGPFVANTKEELQETIQKYRQTDFGGWPWDTNEPVHDKSLGRFSKLPNGEETIK